MTVIIGYTNHLFSVLVADRRITASGRVYSERANKVIVGHFRDGWIAIGYTGLALIDGVPTDDLLVSLVVPSVNARSGISMRVHGDIPQNVNACLGRLITGLERLALSSQLVASQYLEIGVTGVRFDRDFVWPFLLTITKQTGAQHLDIRSKSKAIQFRPSEHAIWISGGWAAARPSALALLSQQVSLVDPRVELGPEIVGEMLRTSALQFGAGELTIGDELCTVINAPFGGGTFIDFHPVAAHTLNGELSRLIGRHRVSYSPWILGHQTVASPLAISSTTTLEIGGNPIVIRGPTQSDIFFLGMDHPKFSGPTNPPS